MLGRMGSPVAHEPMPVRNNLPHVHELVIKDIREKAEVGKVKYGTHLQPYNGRNALIDAYQELLDLAQYLRQRIEEDRMMEGEL